MAPASTAWPAASAACSTATPGQFAAQVIGAVVLVVFGLVVAWAWFHIGNRYLPMRVSRDVELEGLDGPELGALAYPDFALTPARMRFEIKMRICQLPQPELK